VSNLFQIRKYNYEKDLTDEGIIIIKHFNSPNTSQVAEISGESMKKREILINITLALKNAVKSPL
jgi:hypothetical protein